MPTQECGSGLRAILKYPTVATAFCAKGDRRDDSFGASPGGGLSGRTPNEAAAKMRASFEIDETNSALWARAVRLAKPLLGNVRREPNESGRSVLRLRRGGRRDGFFSLRTRIRMHWGLSPDRQ
jgi:hypothetical protein